MRRPYFLRGDPSPDLGIFSESSIFLWSFKGKNSAIEFSFFSDSSSPNFIIFWISKAC